jgi:hypothetical protein
VIDLNVKRKAHEVSTMKRTLLFLVIFLLFGATNALATPFAEFADPNNLILISTGIISLLVIARRQK